MKKEKLISIFAIALLICNLVLIAFIYSNHRRPPMEQGPRNLIIEKLHFDSKQIEQYDNLIKSHQSEIRKANVNLLNIKNELYNCIIDSCSEQVKDSLKDEIGKIQIEIEGIHYKHFTEIEALCNEDQKSAYKELITEIGELFNRRMMKPDMK